MHCGYTASTDFTSSVITKTKNTPPRQKKKWKNGTINAINNEGNYQLTFSHYGDFEKTSEALENGFNSAIVFESLPSKIKINKIDSGYIVVSEESNDILKAVKERNQGNN